MALEKRIWIAECLKPLDCLVESVSAEDIIQFPFSQIGGFILAFSRSSTAMKKASSVCVDCSVGLYSAGVI